MPITNKEISALNGGVPLTGNADDDLLPITDVSDTTAAASGTTKPIEAGELIVKKVRESSGPTVLTLGAVSNGQFLKRSGADVVGVAPASTDISDFAEAVEDKIGAKVVAGTGISVAYNDGTGETTITNSSPDSGAPPSTEDVQDIVGAMLTDSSTIDFTYNDGSGTETASVIDDSVTNAKLANMANATVKGRNTSGTGDPEDVTMSQLAALIKSSLPFEYSVAVSDETTSITTGTAKITFFFPVAVNITGVSASLTGQSSSGAVTIDVNKNGTTIFSTNLTIDASEDTSHTAATPAALSSSPTAFAVTDKVTVDIDGAGTSAEGLKVSFTGTRQ